MWKKNYSLFASLLVNVLLILLLFYQSSPEPGDLEKKNNPIKIFPYLSKRIFSENQNDLLIHFVPLRLAMNEYIAKQKDPIGLYFEYLPTGNSIGVNDQIELRFASLIKLPVIMAIYREIEKGALSKRTIVTITKDDINTEFGTLWKKGVGTKITVDEAINLSLKKSDNTAVRALTARLPQGAIDEVFNSLDIKIDNEKGIPVISPKNYASIFRSLYLSSYLQRTQSNEILSLLTQTDFKDQIPSGVASGIKIAHKIGVYNIQGQKKVFSDCGIVYVPQRPYILCVMTSTSEQQAKAYVGYLSKMVYSYITIAQR